MSSQQKSTKHPSYFRRSIQTSINGRKPTPSPVSVSSLPVSSSSPSLVHQLKESVVQGIGSGIGMSIGDRIVSSIFGARKVQVEHITPTPIPTTSNVPLTSTKLNCDEILPLLREKIEKGESIPEEWKQCEM